MTLLKRCVLVMFVLGIAERGAILSCAAASPNVVLILCDDLGYGDPGCYGGKICTPQIDRLAAGGMRFTDAHTSSAVCSPTRYGLLTGRYNWRSKLQRGVLGGLSPRLIESNRMTVASLLQSRGYRTGCFGKWHLGMDWVVKPGLTVTELNIEPREQVWNVDYSQQIANGPNSVGFDRYFGISASLDMVPYTFIENDHVVALPTEDRDFLLMHARPGGGKTRHGPAAPGFDADEVLPTLTRETIAFIEGSAAGAKDGKPFLAYVPLASPHTPILPKPDWLGRSGMNPYADFVMQTDDAIGQILAALDHHQLTDNTLVILTSDNGCSPQAKFEELLALGHNPSGPLRGMKADLFEGGHRVPMIVRWPGQIVAGSVSQQLVCLTDVLATIAEIISQPLPPQAGEDSVSFLAALKGQPSGRNDLVSHSITGAFAVRQGPWKLLLAPDSGGWSAPRPNTPAAAKLPPVQLYHLGDDLGEQQNLHAEQPDRVSQLTALLESFVANGRSTPGERQANFGPINIRSGMPNSR